MKVCDIKESRFGPSQTCRGKPLAAPFMPTHSGACPSLQGAQRERESSSSGCASAHGGIAILTAVSWMELLCPMQGAR